MDFIESFIEKLLIACGLLAPLIGLAVTIGTIKATLSLDVLLKVLQ